MKTVTALSGQLPLGEPEWGGTVNYQYRYVAPSNTGIASGFDLNNNGSIVTTPVRLDTETMGFGNFPGQYGMVLYSSTRLTPTVSAPSELPMEGHARCAAA